MTSLTWNAPEGRFFDVGLDRGVLYPKNKPAVAWNGLISVDETGSESATTFFMDGRPYLHLPRPKEYSGTIKAFTYPDEFSEMMGVVEATDGLYLDSQMGDSFDLSYRTKVGDGISGAEVGHKIHLIYNATVSPEGIAYETMSNSIAPVEFTWQIQAVPVPVVGYRPTAHIIIDTRKLDPLLISELENLVYGGPVQSTVDGGTPTSIHMPNDIVDGLLANTPLDGEVLDGGAPAQFENQPGLPHPQIIFDMLNFGDTVTLTDNGNGTWTARGSQDVVKDLGNGLYEISNVEVNALGGGAFSITTNS